MVGIAIIVEILIILFVLFVIDVNYKQKLICLVKYKSNKILFINISYNNIYKLK